MHVNAVNDERHGECSVVYQATRGAGEPSLFDLGADIYDQEKSTDNHHGDE
jgi:hypothetical protein